MQSWPLAVRTLAITAFVVPLMVFLLLPSSSASSAHGYTGQESLRGSKTLRGDRRTTACVSAVRRPIADRFSSMPI
jgi:hypothetical protein